MGFVQMDTGRVAFRADPPPRADAGERALRGLALMARGLAVADAHTRALERRLTASLEAQAALAARVEALERRMAAAAVPEVAQDNAPPASPHAPVLRRWAVRRAARAAGGFALILAAVLVSLSWPWPQHPANAMHLGPAAPAPVPVVRPSAPESAAALMPQVHYILGLAAREPALAARHLETAARGGVAPAALALARMHEDGALAGGPDPRAALVWYKRAADAGSAPAQAALARLAATSGAEQAALEALLARLARGA
jgi:TPR repeat protein